MRIKTGILALAMVALASPGAYAARAKPPAPAAGKRVVAKRVTGKVTVKHRKLTRATALKLGTTIDATKGSVKVTGKIGRKTVSATFSGAAFKITQAGKKGKLTATLKGGGITCKVPYGKAGAKRSLRAKAVPGFVVKGCFAASQAKGKAGKATATAAAAATTTWTTTDTPGATAVAVAGGAVDVTGADGKVQALSKGGSITGGPTGLAKPEPPAPPTPTPPVIGPPLGYYLVRFDEGTYSGYSVNRTDVTVTVSRQPTGEKRIIWNWEQNYASDWVNARGQTFTPSYLQIGCPLPLDVNFYSVLNGGDFQRIVEDATPFSRITADVTTVPNSDIRGSIHVKCESGSPVTTTNITRPFRTVDYFKGG